MATRAELVEAHTFERRRLLAAFVSGAPEGCSEEPVRSGAAVLAGCALAVLLLVGSVIAGQLSG